MPEVQRMTLTQFLIEERPRYPTPSGVAGLSTRPALQPWS